MRIVLSLLLGLAGPAARAAEPAASVIFAGADTRATGADGAVRVLARGETVFAGDLIETGPARAQLRFTDGQMLSLRPRTRFRVDDYHYTGTPDGSERGFFSLLAGAIRAITGAIGREREAAYRVDTVAAALGIRGTVYEARLCAGGCPGEADGLYVRVSRGLVTLTNAAGSFQVAAGQAAFVADFDTPVRIEAPSDAPGASDPARELRPEQRLEHDLLESLEPVQPSFESTPHSR